MLFGQFRHGRKQRPAVDHRAVATGARQKLGASVRQTSPFLVDVAFAIIDHRDLGGLAQRRLGPLRTLEPAVGLLFLDRLLAIILALGFEAPPDLDVEQTEAMSEFGIHRQHRMHEQPDIAAVANRAEAAFASPLALIIDFAGILDHQHMTIGAGLGNPRSLVQHHFRDRDPIVHDKASERHLLGARISELTQTYRLSIRHALQQPRTVFLRRASPKCPRFISATA